MMGTHLVQSRGGVALASKWRRFEKFVPASGKWSRHRSWYLLKATRQKGFRRRSSWKVTRQSETGRGRRRRALETQHIRSASWAVAAAHASAEKWTGLVPLQRPLAGQGGLQLAAEPHPPKQAAERATTMSAWQAQPRPQGWMGRWQRGCGSAAGLVGRRKPRSSWRAFVLFPRYPAPYARLASRLGALSLAQHPG